MLQEVAGCLRAAMRASDVVCRYGGDEFAMLLVDTGLAEAAHAVTRAAAELARRSGPWGDGIPVSAGIAAYPHDGRTPEALTATADRRMYRARRMGVPVCAQG